MGMNLRKTQTGGKMVCIHEKGEKVTWRALWADDGTPLMVCSKGNVHGMLSAQFGVFDVAQAFYDLGMLPRAFIDPIKPLKCDLKWEKDHFVVECETPEDRDRATKELERGEVVVRVRERLCRS